RDREEFEEHRNRKTRHLAVSLDEAAPEKVIWIDVMHAEGQEQALSDDWKIVAAPGIGPPMNESGTEIGRRHATGRRQRHPPVPRTEPHHNAKPQRREHEERRHE